MSGPKMIRFLQSLKIPEGPKAGKPLKLAPFQKQFVRGAFSKGIDIAVLSIGRGNAKTALSSGIALGELLGVASQQPRREVIIAARTKEQGRIAWDFIKGYSEYLPDEQKANLKFRQMPRLEIENKDDGSIVRVIPADGKSVLGTAPTLVLMDERGHWDRDKGDALEAALLSGLGKRSGRALIISTSAADDSHPFSQWLDNEGERIYRQEHRPLPNLPVDDLESLEIANPGAKHGIGSSLDWLQSEARRAIKRGGSTLTNFRLYNRNERVSGETRDLLLTTDEWLTCEVNELPERSGPVVIGIDAGGSASMSAAAFYWPETGRLECLGTFPSSPNLLDRGQNDAVGTRYTEMQERGELSTLGDKTVPLAPWLVKVADQVAGEQVAALVADRFKQQEMGEAIDRAGLRCPIVWRGMGFRDGNEDCERFRRAAYDGDVKSAPSLLLRSAFADAVCLRDPANNIKLTKARSRGRIDPVSATVLAVAQGSRMKARPNKSARAPVWL